MTARTSVEDDRNELEVALADDRAFEAWHRLTLPRVYGYLLRRCAGDASLAEELTQQTFIAAIDQRARFDGRSEAVTWLCGIARHKLADHFRALERDERRHRRMVLREIDVSSEARPDPIEERDAVARTLRSLPASQRAVLIFVVLDDLPVAEAARLIGKSPKATESLLFRARERFRRAYTDEAPR